MLRPYCICRHASKCTRQCNALMLFVREHDRRWEGRLSEARELKKWQAASLRPSADRACLGGRLQLAVSSALSFKAGLVLLAARFERLLFLFPELLPAAAELLRDISKRNVGIQVLELSLDFSTGGILRSMHTTLSKHTQHTCGTYRVKLPCRPGLLRCIRVLLGLSTAWRRGRRDSDTGAGCAAL